MTPVRAGLAAGGGAVVATLVTGAGFTNAIILGAVFGAVGWVSVRQFKPG